MPVTLDHLTIGYNGKHGQQKVVISDICATIHSGQLTCLVGSNGVGKSTLLRTLATFQPKLSGNIFIGDRELDSFTPRELATVIGVVLTDKPDVANMTAMDMVLMGRAPYTGFWGGYSNDDKLQARKAMTMVDIDRLANRMVSTLSDGERQKVMIAKSLAQETPIIYLDEPTAFLDYPSKVETMRLLHRICHKAQKTVFLSTHDIELALELADTLWLMDCRNGGIVTGTPEDLALNGHLASFFYGRGVTFDSATGTFHPDHEIVAQVKLTGLQGLRRTMLEKALLRNGLATTDNDTDVCIEVKETSFVVYTPATTETVVTIADVLNLIAG